MSATARFQKYQTTAVSNNTTSTSFVNFGTISSVPVTKGNPVFVGLMPDPTNSSDIVSVGVNGPTVSAGSGATSGQAFIHLLRGATIISRHWFDVFYNALGVNSAAAQGNFPPGMVWTIDRPTVGVYSYSIQVSVLSGSRCFVNNCVLVAWEY